ncbi:NAD+ synthase [Delftia sp. PS-11]|uniref:NAD+ synthase n=1 Tax=Delftia sp. PS-11 TaxID=2767222 RepID=UPI002456AFC8|nr:NAD+ synthase [Delftia sp. PS-11]KAJ8744761.1 NAD+ synthase [Delftia sp. PS-11]
MTLSICTAQLNFVVGDLPGNVLKIIDAAREAYAKGARLLLTPELALSGYAAEDLYLRPAFVQACDAAVQQIARETAQWPGLALVLGHPRSEAGVLRNTASVLRDGCLECSYDKQCLPNYDVFDEQRYFKAASESCVIEVQGLRVGLLICEDAWYPQPARAAAAAGAQLLAVINASPFHGGKPAEREAVLAERARETGLPLVYAHLVGGQDEIVFDGGSFAMQADGCVAARAPAFAETLALVHAEASPAGVALSGECADLQAHLPALWSALVLAVRDYVGKNRFPGALLGLSGGIDSALVLAIAVDALGADKVHTVMMPSPYTADISWIDARDMAERVGVRYDEISIAPQFEAFKAALATAFAGRAEDTTEENLQARIRGTLLMGLSNKFGAVVLTTGNKSEMSTGYCTLYGDMAGGFAVIKDVLKTEVFALARWRNENDPFGTGLNPIPERIITRPPSAELRPDQKDQDSLPPYEVLDAIVRRYMENNESISSIVAEGYDSADVERVTRLIQINEYKRRQAPVGPRVTRRSFGKDWRYPITNRFRA